MIQYPQIDPVIVKVGPLAVRWYGMMYLAGFTASYLLIRRQLGEKRGMMKHDELDTLFFYLILGLILGARLGYIVFYDLKQYLASPSEIFAVWHGGMSFHGGLIGSVIAGVLFCRNYRKNFWEMADLVIVTAPIGLGFGRLGNFINAELYGRVTDVPWAMVFPGGGALPRHPSQLYELLLEGILLFTILWSLRRKNFRPGVLLSFFLMLYGIFRFIVEFFREPDAHLGFIVGPLTMGQLLSAGVMIAGGVLFVLRTRRPFSHA